jgi:hypothetical protein
MSDDAFKDAVIQKLDALAQFVKISMRAQATIMRMIVKDSNLSPDRKQSVLEAIEKFDQSLESPNVGPGD